MDANAVPLLNVFERKVRLEVPLFQRQYVWEREVQWEPLWEDISRKFSQQLDGAVDSPPHFLGAMVLDLKQTPITHVERRQIIDGQQRLTTFQIFLAAFRDFAAAEGCEPLAQECDKYLLNSGMMNDASVEQFKVWPTQLDRSQFSDVVLSKSKSEILAKHPLNRRKWARHPDPRPKMVEAYLYFFEQLSQYFKGVGLESPVRADESLSSRLEKCFHALRSSLKVVVIDLGKDDDPQVIFETLNARGAPLLPADLMRNYIFLRAARENEDQEQLYNQFWKPFDDDFWREPVDQRRRDRPLSDLFMQYFVSSRRCVDVAVKHLYVEYKFWIEKEHPFAKARDELATLARQGADFKRLVSPPPGDVCERLSEVLRAFEVGTAFPLLLAILDTRPTDEELGRIGGVLESYVVRRSVAGLSTKNYNRVFLQLTRALKGAPMTASSVEQYLSGLVGPSVEWPTDGTFHDSWLNEPAYELMGSARTSFILQRLNEALLDSRGERVRIESPLTVEHILPQDWLENWPLSDGSTGMNAWELQQASTGDERSEATRTRDRLVQSMGNLTLLTQPLNSSVSNNDWEAKKEELLKASILTINQQLRTFEDWNEASIQTRGESLYELAIALWPRPTPKLSQSAAEGQ